MDLIRSNRTENLADALASRVREQPLGAFEKEIVVVQSRGMERWLTLALAQRLGIWSNPSFPFPRAVVEEALSGLSLGASEKARAYERDQLKWTIAGLLAESAPEELAAYLGQPPEADRVLRLADSVAAVFDDYVVFRPELLAAWGDRDDGDWQADLWRRIVKRLGPHDLASRVREAVAALRGGRRCDSFGFQRLHLFALETLPPLFLELFSVLSRSIPTTFYLLEPSSEYVSDVDPSPKLPAEMRDEPGDGHPLLYELGRLARDFQQLLLEVGDSVRHEADLFETPDRATLLGSLQADILEFRSPSEAGSLQTIDGSDESITIHACTGPMREAQVLHDRIRAALEDDRSLQPEDIVVMTPDLETYAPAFRAVFGQDEQQRIPYEVHDRRTRDDAFFYEDFLAVLEVLDSRFSVLDLIGLMDADSLREDFRFTQEERSRLGELLEAGGIRWGIDAEHRAELQFPAEELHTWRAGLGRLFLGFASPPDSTEVFEGVLPRGAPDLRDAELVARLARLGEVLFDFQGRTRRVLDVGDWVLQLQRLSSLLFAEDDESSPAVRVLRSALDDLGELAENATYRGAIALKTVRRELSAMLGLRAPAVGFLRRGVTLTELVPLRSVPFRVVCLMGMSEEAFPRADKRPSFDATRSEHKAGDRNKRDDDRHSFLQAILCARDRLIITYSATSASSRGVASPSPVVWALRETARQYYTLPDGEPILEATIHPLYPFDSRYFRAGALPQSASQRYLEITEALLEPPVAPDPIELRSEVESEDAALSVRELSAWLWNPSAAFIEQVLRARFGLPSLYEPASALTALGPLQAAMVGNEALRAGLGGRRLDAFLAASPEFPDGTWGALERQRMGREIHNLNARTTALAKQGEAASKLVAIDVEGIVVEGRIDGIYGDERVLKRFTAPGKQAELTAWIEHLLLQARGGLPARTHLVLRGSETRPTLVSFSSVPDPHAQLATLVELYRCSREAPLPLFGKPSRAFVEKLAVSTAERAFTAAEAELERQRKWDPCLRFLWGARDPFEDPAWREAFGSAASRLYAPLFEHRSEE